MHWIEAANKQYFMETRSSHWSIYPMATRLFWFAQKVDQHKPLDLYGRPNRFIFKKEEQK